MGFPGGVVMKNPPAYVGDSRDAGLIPGSGSSPEGGNGNPLPYSCLENPMDRGAWQTIVKGVTKSQSQLRNKTAATNTYIYIFFMYIYSFLFYSIIGCYDLS